MTCIAISFAFFLEFGIFCNFQNSVLPLMILMIIISHLLITMNMMHRSSSSQHQTFLEMGKWKTSNVCYSCLNNNFTDFNEKNKPEILIVISSVSKKETWILKKQMQKLNLMVHVHVLGILRIHVLKKDSVLFNLCVWPEGLKWRDYKSVYLTAKDGILFR